MTPEIKNKYLDHPGVRQTMNAIAEFGEEFLTRDDINRISAELHLDPGFSFVVVQAYCEEVFRDGNGNIVPRGQSPCQSFISGYRISRN
jgi:hypothetical protein